MQNLSDTSSEPKSDRANGMEDSSMMTIEYLRARLLVERSVSKAAKERADELAKRVRELEDQLKAVTLQRKTAEKATLDVLAFLASRGISDISEACESDSDQDESLCESNVGEHVTSKKEENYECCGLKEHNDSSSDHDSTPSSSRSLSWKGHKETAQQFDMKSFDPSIKRQTSLAQVVSSPRRRPGKSCRQIRRKELRSVEEDSRNDSTKSDEQDDDTVNSSDQCSNRLDSRGEYASGSRKHTSSGEMEIALEHQPELIGCYKAQEKAQKDWEEKHKENYIGTPDSSEPGEHSDVTVDKDENKSPALHSDNGMETQFQDKPSFTHFNNVMVTHHSDTQCSHNDNFVDTKASSPSIGPTAPAVDSCVHTSVPAEEPNIHSALVPQQESLRLGNVLGILQQAKSLIKQRMNSFPETPGLVQKAPETRPIRDGDWFKVPVGCPGLFRVPTDPQSHTSGRALLSSECSPDLIDFNHYSGAASTIQGDQYNSSLLNPQFNHPNANPLTGKPVISDRQLRFDFHFDTNKSLFQRAPDIFPSLPLNQISFSPVLSEAQKPSPASPLCNGHDFRSRMYR